MKRLISVIASAFCAISINATTIHVPGDQPTIQAGIDAAGTDDTVLVAPGDYQQHLVFSNVSMMLQC